MCPGETDEFATNLSNEPTDSTPEADVESTAKPTWSRRTFLKAAALGAAAASLINKGADGGLHLGAASTLAHNPPDVNCRANDVRIPSPGIILNEPCGCTGTFDAQVRFELFNNTGTNRYCVTLHLCPVTLPDGTVFDPGDVVFQEPIPPGTTFRTVTIEDYPCGAGELCFGSPVEDGRSRCPAGSSCCTVISWEPNAPQGGAPCPENAAPVPSKCRLQRICIRGRGVTTLDCDTTASGVQDNCEVDCGGDIDLRLCTTSPASLGPFTFELFAGTGTCATLANPIQTATGAGPCHTFTVQDVTAGGTYTGRITDSTGCATCDTVTLTVTTVEPEIAVSGNTGCTLGNLTFTASVPGFTDCTFNWFIDNVAAGTGSTLNYTADPDTVCHTVRVEASCGGGGCVGTASRRVSQCVQTTLDCT